MMAKFMEIEVCVKDLSQVIVFLLSIKVGGKDSRSGIQDIIFWYEFCLYCNTVVEHLCVKTPANPDIYLFVSAHSIF